MEAIILVGGKGTRLRTIINDCPKPMSLVHGRPFLEWLLILMRNQGVNKFILCTGYMGEMISTRFGDGKDLNIKIQYSKEYQQLGTAGAIKNALNKISGDKFIVMNGDSYCRFNLNRLINEHSKNEARISIWSVPINRSNRFGIINVDKNNRIISFLEKEKSNKRGLINAGIYMFNRCIVEKFPERYPISLENDIFPKFSKRGMYVVVGDGPFIDIGVPDSYREANEFFRKEKKWLMRNM